MQMNHMFGENSLNEGVLTYCQFDLKQPSSRKRHSNTEFSINNLHSKMSSIKCPTFLLSVRAMFIHICCFGVAMKFFIGSPIPELWLPSWMSTKALKHTDGGNESNIISSVPLNPYWYYRNSVTKLQINNTSKVQLPVKCHNMTHLVNDLVCWPNHK